MDEIEEAASRLRRAWKLRDGPISNLTWLLENHGVIVARVGMEARALDGVSCWLNNRPFVLVNEEVPSPRARFDLCHELGHLILHRKTDPKLLNHKATFKLIENQAHRFAAAFAFPQASFTREAIPLSLERFLELKPRWKLSVKMMLYRAGELELASSDLLSTLYRRYSWRKWNRGEPLDDMEHETPRVLDKAATLIIESGTVKADDLLHSFALTEHEVCRLASIRRPYLEPRLAEVIEFPGRRG
jgi:Zn-dependent peptidase ImmA (M78 family)